MRWTALLGDLLFLYPGLILLIKWKMRKFNQDIQNTYLMLVLSCPILLLIDHGHFQYNSIMLGFSVLGAYYLG